jgi:hypothetical protein
MFHLTTGSNSGRHPQPGRLAPCFYPFHREWKRFLGQRFAGAGAHRAIVGGVVELQTQEGSATVSNVNRAARLHRLLVILSMATARPGIRAVDLAETLKVSSRTVFRDLAELQRLGFPVTFGNGYPAQQELFRRRRRQEISQIMADLVDQQLEVVRRKLPPEDAEQLVTKAIQYLPMEAAEAVTRALAKAARR